MTEKALWSVQVLSEDDAHLVNVMLRDANASSLSFYGLFWRTKGGAGVRKPPQHRTQV